MIVTGAFLAESAVVVDNKLNVRGGVISSCQVGPDRIARADLVVLLRSGVYDRTATVKVDIVRPAGDTRQDQIEVPASALGGEIGFAVFPVQIPVLADGRYELTISSDPGDGVVSLPLNVHG